MPDHPGRTHRPSDEEKENPRRRAGQAYVLAGDAKKNLSSAILADYAENDERQERDYEYYPTDWYAPYLARRRACGWGLYGSLGIEHGDKERVRAQRARNYVFFDAPVGSLFSIERRLNTGSWTDIGMFLQNVMQAARGEGLHTCLQAAQYYPWCRDRSVESESSRQLPVR